MTNIFIYGTLRNDEIINALVGKTYIKVPYTLASNAVYQVKDRSFPGIVYEKGKKARGFLVENIDDADLAIIDCWEDSRFVPTEIKTMYENKQTVVRFYLWSVIKKLPGGWDNDSYRATHMDKCVNELIPNDNRLAQLKAELYGV